MDVRKKLEQLILDKGMTFQEVSLKIGKNKTYIQQYISKCVPRKLNSDMKRQICRAIGVPENALDEDLATHERDYYPQYLEHREAFIEWLTRLEDLKKQKEEIERSINSLNPR